MVTYYEDIDVGEAYEAGERTLTRDDIVEFAEEYDPQPFHVDEAAAAESPMGGLIASGWQTAAICMRLLVEVMDDEEWASLGARGVDELRWIRPVRPGDTIHVELEVVEKRPSESNPAVGHVDSQLTGYNQDDEAVISWIGLGMIERRQPAE